MQDHSYMLKCITDKGKDLFMMCSVFAEELNKGKIVEIKQITMNKFMIILESVLYVGMCLFGLYWFKESETTLQALTGLCICVGGIAYICEIEFEKWKD